MVTWDDESAYLHLGYLAASGRISLFQDEVLGTRMPLPFYVLGATQLAFGRSLLAARLAGVVLALGSLALVAGIGRRLGDDLAGILAAAFFATQAVFVGYLATATYHALAALILVTSLALAVCRDGRIARVASVGVLSLLVLTRTNLWVIPPAVLAFLLVRARSWTDRLMLAVAASVVPLTYFFWDTRHLKVFAYVPGLRRAVAPLGYHSTLTLTAFEPFPLADWPQALLRLVRMYEFWALAVVGLLALLAARRAWQPRRRPLDRRLVLLIALFVYIAASQAIIFADRLKVYPAYFPSWAPILPVILGVAYAALVSTCGFGRRTRWVVMALLALVLAAPMVIVRHPLLPLGPERPVPANRALEAAATHLRHSIGEGSRVFLLGNSLPLYLAGRDPYIQQIYSTETLAAVEDRQAIPTHGLWGLAEIDRWLSADADYAVIQPTVLEGYRINRPAQVERIEAWLARYFDRRDRVDDYPWFVYDVYERRERPATR